MTFNFHDGEAIHMFPQNWGHGQYCKACSLA